MVSSGCGPVAFVDDDRDIRPEVRGRALDQPPRLGLVRDVGPQRDGVAALLPDQAHDVLRAGRRPRVVHRNPGAVGGQPQRDRAPEPPRRPGHQRDAPLQPTFHRHSFTHECPPYRRAADPATEVRRRRGEHIAAAYVGSTA